MQCFFRGAALPKTYLPSHVCGFQTRRTSTRPRPGRRGSSRGRRCQPQTPSPSFPSLHRLSQDGQSCVLCPSPRWRVPSRLCPGQPLRRHAPRRQKCNCFTVLQNVRTRIDLVLAYLFFFLNPFLDFQSTYLFWPSGL